MTRTRAIIARAVLGGATLLCAAAVAAQPVLLARTVPYADPDEISSKVRSECVKLQEQLAEFTRDYARSGGIEVRLVDDVDPAAPGRVLQLEIVEAVSMGNAFIGHQKYTRIGGTLYENGEKVASFRARRNSMGGAFAGYKGSCSVLGRTVKALGQDVGQWLKNPQDGARLGDM